MIHLKHGSSRSRVTDDLSGATDFAITVELMLQMIYLGRLTSQEQWSSSYGWFVWGLILQKQSSSSYGWFVLGNWFCSNSRAQATDDSSGNLKEQSSSSYGWFVLGNWFCSNSWAHVADDLSGDWFCNNSWARATDNLSGVTDFTRTGPRLFAGSATEEEHPEEKQITLSLG